MSNVRAADAVHFSGGGEVESAGHRSFKPRVDGIRIARVIDRISGSGSGCGMSRGMSMSMSMSRSRGRGWGRGWGGLKVSRRVGL